MEPVSPNKLSASTDSSSSHNDIYRKVVNPRYLHLVTSYLEEEQIRVFLNSFIHRLIQVTGIQDLIYCKFEINVVTDSRGKTIDHRQGSTYVQLSDERVGWVLLKKDLDGIERVKVEEKKEEFSGSTSSPDSVKSSSSWADMVEEEEMWAFSHTIPLPPLVEIWPIKYTEEQLKFIRTAKWNSETVVMEINPARIKDFSRLTKADKEFGCASNILYSISTITDEKEKDFQDLFRQFATDSKTDFFWQIKNQKKGKGKYVTYLVVEFRDYTNKEGRVEKHAFIFFDPTTFDAQYAFNMRRQVVVRGNNHVFIFARKCIL